MELDNPGWAATYEAERARLEEALGDVTEGGVLERIAHVGSTSVPGLPARPCVDIVALAYPVPLPDDRVRAVTDLGYDHLGESGVPGRHLFRKGPDAVCLQVVSFDGGLWARHLVLRDYLRADAAARRRYGDLKLELAARHLSPHGPEDREAYERGKAPLLERLEQEAFVWHVATTGFGPVRTLAGELAGLACPWFVSSGWALDLFAGAPSRHHEDLDVVVARDDQLHLQRHLLARGWRLHEVVDGSYVAWEPGATVAPTSHQVHARRAEGEFIDFLFEPREADQWLFRRQLDIRRPLAEVTLSFEGIPYLAPEVVLLFKARPWEDERRAKDQSDFERTLPRLDAGRRRWLLRTLAALKPDHPWLGPLEAPEGAGR